MKVGAPGSFGAQLKALREAAGFTQEELATIAGLSVHGVSALERGHRRRPHVDTVRALSAALDLTGPSRDAFLESARGSAPEIAGDELGDAPLPIPVTSLVGREFELQTLGQWLSDPAARLITLVGPGGVGKTRLVLELARALAAESAMRVVFVSLAAIRDHAFVAPAIAEALGLADVTALDLPARARAACAHRPTLLVLDNCEHLPEAVPLVGELLSMAGSLRLLATSRAPLHVRGEREYAVGPLVLDVASERLAPADLARVPAVRLFIERVRDVQPDFRLTPANAATVAAICRRLDALPLALELAARWIKVLTLEGLLRRLESDRLLATISGGDLPERQQTMNAAVAWSYQLLDVQEQRAFRRFGALPGLFPIDAAEAVLAGPGHAAHTGQALWAVGALIDKSLLLRSDTPVVSRGPLYLMLETVRAYAGIKLTASGELDEALERLSGYCIAEAALAAAGLVGPAQGDWLNRIREDLESYRTVMAWLITRGRTTDACRIAWSLFWFWAIRGHAIEGLGWYEQVLGGPPLAPDVEATALTGAGGMRYEQGHLERAGADLRRALVLAHDAGDPTAVLHAEWILGYVEHGLGNLDAAHDLLTRSVVGFQAHAMPWGVGQAFAGLAWVALAADELGEAERLLEQARSALRDVGPWFLSLVEYLSGILAVRRGNPDQAVSESRQTLLRVRELKDKFAFVHALLPLALAAGHKGHHAQVARILGAQDATTESTGVAIVDQSGRVLRAQAEQDARTRLGPANWARAYAAGRTTSIESLIKDIDSSREYAPEAPASHSPAAKRLSRRTRIEPP